MQHIFIVDDDPDIRELLVQTLTDEGYAVVSYSEGTQALVDMHSTPPALVLLDLMMPILSGGELLQLIRADTRIAHVPIVLVSASRELEQTSSVLGADACLAKPFDLDALLAIVQGFTPATGLEATNSGAVESRIASKKTETAEPEDAGSAVPSSH